MIKIKFCGLTRLEDIEAANALQPEYIGFVFFNKSRRNISFDKALELKKHLADDIQAAGVFVDEDIEKAAKLLNSNIIDIAQLHGHEDEAYIKRLRSLTGKPVIKAFNISFKAADNSDDNAFVSDISRINECSADYVLIDGKAAGSGKAFDWNILGGIERPYFLAGGLNTDNIKDAIKLKPYAVDVSSGIETNGVKDKDKMKKFMQIVRNGSF